LSWNTETGMDLHRRDGDQAPAGTGKPSPVCARFLDFLRKGRIARLQPAATLDLNQGGGRLFW